MSDSCGKYCPVYAYYYFSVNSGNASVETTLDGAPPRGCARTPSTKTKTAGTSLTKDLDYHASPIDVPATDVSVTPQMSVTVDEEDSGPSTVEHHGRVECFRTPREHHEDSRQQSGKLLNESPGGHREPGERCASWSTARSDLQRMANGDSQKGGDRVGLTGDKGDTKDGNQKRCSSYGDRRQQRPSSGEPSHKERMRYRKEKLGRRSKRREDQSERRTDTPTSRYRSAGDTSDKEDKYNSKKWQPPGRRSLEVSGTRNNANGDIEETEEIEHRSELHPTKSARDIDPDIVIEPARGIGTDGGERVVVRERAHGGESTKRSRVYSSDIENVETIELGEGTRYSDAHDHAKDDEQHQGDERLPAAVGTASNQDEDTEFDEDAEIDREVPQLEIGNWGNPPPGQSATSRLHRHISKGNTDAGNLKGSVPPPKEFLTQRSLEPVVSEQHDAGRAGANAEPNCKAEETISADFLKSTSSGRRRSAADLEWSDGGETPDVRVLTDMHNQSC